MREKIKNYLKERYSDIGIKKEIIMINSAIVSAAVLLTFLFCFFLNLEKSTQNIEKIARQLTEEQYHTVNSNIPHLEGQIFALMQNKRLQQLLAEAGTEPLDVFSRDGIRTELEQMCHFYHFIDFVVVKDLQGIWYGSGGSSGLDFIRQWDSENGERLKAQTEKCIWEIEDGEIYVEREIFNVTTMERLGTIVLNINQNYFNELIGLPRNSMNYCYLLSDTGKCYTYTESEGVPRWSDISPKILYEEGYQEKYLFHDGTVYLMQALMGGTGSWQIVNLIPGNVFTDGWKTSIMISILIGGCAVAVAILLISKFSRNLSARIEGVIGQMDRIADGEFHTEYQSERRDEIDKIRCRLNILGKQIEQLLENTVAEEKQKKEMEVQMLQLRYYAVQSQMNPHFIYNALETISSMALLYGAAEVSNAVCECAALFRANVRRIHQFVTLEDELEYVKLCMRFYELAYPNRIDTEYRISPELQECMVPSFLLHPLIENIIVHGVSKSVKRVKILVSCKQRGDMIKIAVCDNSIGISREKQQQLLDAMKETDIWLNEDSKAPHTEIGLPNIYYILKRSFGERADLKLYSREERGTCIFLSFPRERQIQN